MDHENKILELFEGHFTYMQNVFSSFLGALLGGGGDPKCRTDFEISVLRPLFYR